MTARATSPLVRPRARTSSITTAATTANAMAVRTGAWFVKTPTATPASATWPMPSPMRDSRRWTRKTPTIGAARPTRNAATSARCMKSWVRISGTAASGQAIQRSGGGRRRGSRVVVVVMFVAVVLDVVGHGIMPPVVLRGRAVEGDPASVELDDPAEDAAQCAQLVGDDEHGC